MDPLEEAIIYSTIMHQGKVRKIKEEPYILHPLEVAQILSTMTDDKEVIAAGVLHDVADNTDGTLEEVKKRFGKRIEDLVASKSDSQYYPGEGQEDSWMARREESLKALKRSRDIGVKMLWLADMLSNIRALATSFGEVGDKTWDYLEQKDPDQQRWFYQTVAEYIEMDLNRTGAYKEYITNINYIWPGTFDSRKARYRKYQEVSVDGCELIGKGAKGEVYRYAQDLIVKVYNENNTYKDVELETELGKKVFILGLPTAISFGIVSVGKRYGAMFELLEASTMSEKIAKDARRTTYYARMMADLAKTIHAAEAENEGDFPDASIRLLEFAERGLGPQDPELEAKVRDLILAMPPTRHIIHGDLHTKNVMIQNGEPLFIDVDRMSTGHPIVDIANMYMFYIAYGEMDRTITPSFMGFSSEVAGEFFNEFIRSYLDTDDEEHIQKVVDRAALLGYVRLVGQIQKSRQLTEKQQSDLAFFMEKIRDLATRVDDLAAL